MHLGLFVYLFIFCVVDGNEIVSSEDNNNDKGKGKYEWKLISEDESVEQPKRGLPYYPKKNLHIILINCLITSSSTPSLLFLICHLSTTVETGDRR